MSLISGTIGAIMGSDSTESAAQTSAQAQETAAQTAADAQYKTFAGQEALNQPYMDASQEAIGQLQSAILGGPQNYQAPGYSYDIQTGKWNGPDGTVNSPPQLSTTYDLKTSPEFQADQQYTQEALHKSLLAMGRGNSSYGAYLSGQLASEGAQRDMQTQISNLSGLAGIGGASTSALTSAAGNVGNNVSNIATNVGNSNSLAALMSGQAQSSLYSGMGASSGAAASTALKVYDLYQKYSDASDVAEAV